MRGPCAGTFHKSLIYKVKLLILNPRVAGSSPAGGIDNSGYGNRCIPMTTDAYLGT